MTKQIDESERKRTELLAYYNDPDKLAIEFLQGFIDTFGDRLAYGVNCDSGKPFYKLRNWQNQFYLWDSGKYVKLTDHTVKTELTNFLAKLNETKLEPLHGFRVKVTSHLIVNIIICVIARTFIREQVEINTWLNGISRGTILPVENGLVYFNNRDNRNWPKLKAHNPEYFNQVQLPFKYEPDATCPKWMNFLDDVLEGDIDRKLLLQQWAGYLFRPDLREQKFLLCVGEGANGKGVFFEVVQALVGRENCSQVGLPRFGNPFALYDTLGKTVNLTNESSSFIEPETESIFKSFVAGDRMNFERKFKESVSATPTAKIMIATNSLPRFNDKTRAVWRRILLMPFDKEIPENVQVKDLAEQLKTELPGILNWAIVGLQKLNESGGFSIPEINKDLLEQYRRDSDPTRAFLLENYMYSPNGYGMPCGELYREYKLYCEQNGYKAMGNRLFGHQVRRAFPELKRTRPGSGDSRDWIYEGLTSQTSQEIPI